MNLNFRQGLISFQAGAFLISSSTTGFVDLNVSPTPLIGTIAHGSSDYLLKFDTSVLGAWGPMVSGFDNYLYIELNLISGGLSYGISTREPVSSTTQPASPTASMMWFDLNEKVFKVRSVDNSKWIISPRLVLGYVENGNVNQTRMYTRGSVVGLNEPGRPGYLMFDSQLRPLRTASGELLTQDTPVRVKTTVGTSGVLSTPINNFIPVRANETIPAMTLVYFSGSDAVSVASSNPALAQTKVPVGIVEGGLAPNEVGVITQSGEITYDQWNWQASDIGKPLYCGFNGELTRTRPSSIQAFRVGYVKNSKTILFYIDSETQQQVLAMAGSIISGVPPIQSVTSTNSLGEIVTSVSMQVADETHDGYLSSAKFLVFDSFAPRIDSAETNITSLQSGKSNVGHVHTIANVTGLQSTIDDFAIIVNSKASKVVPAAVGNLSALNGTGDLIDSSFKPADFATAAHVHFISEVTGLQTELNGKAPLVHTHVIGDTTGLQTALNDKADFNHSHVVSNVTGLQALLDAKAPTVHGHVITDVTGLQSALDGRSLTGHTHAITDVINLQSTLNGKAALVHTHAIADISNLQSSLDGKAGTVHTHTASNITDFSEAVDDRVGALLRAGTGITLQYLDGSNELTISSTASSALLTSGYSALGGQQVDWSTSSISFGTAFVSTPSGTGTPASPGTMTVSLKPLQFFEGGTLRSTYPNAAVGNVQTSILFSTGLTASVSGTNNEVLTVASMAPTSLDALDDVVLTEPSSGQVLSYNGTEWVNASPSAGGSILVPSSDLTF